MSASSKRRRTASTTNADLNRYREAFTEAARKLMQFQERTRKTFQTLSTSQRDFSEINPKSGIVHLKRSLVWLVRERTGYEKIMATGTVPQNSARFTVPSRVVDTGAIRERIVAIEGTIQRGLFYYRALFSTFEKLVPELIGALSKVPEAHYQTVEGIEVCATGADLHDILSRNLLKQVEFYIASAPEKGDNENTLNAFADTWTSAEVVLVEASNKFFGTLKDTAATAQQKQQDDLEAALTPLRDMLLSRMDSDTKDDDDIHRQP